jgi:hypothetical protein
VQAGGLVAVEEHSTSQAPPLPLDSTRPPRAWTRRQRAQLAAQLYPVLRPAEIAARLGVSTSTVRDYLSDPDGERARARRQAGGRGVCAQCGCSTAPSRGTRRFGLCARCAGASRATWTSPSVVDAYTDWWGRFGVQPTSADWNHTHAVRRGGVALQRFRSRRWPTMTVIVRLFGGWSQFSAVARQGSEDAHLQPPA